MSQRKTARSFEREQNDSEQFDRFEQLTRRLLAVPKKEADKERQKKNGKKTR